MISGKRLMMLYLLFMQVAMWCTELGVGGDPIVETRLGKIVGSSKFVKGIRVNQYLKIPYAKPPTGDLRFQKPEPVEAWSETLYATTEPPACVQYTQNPFPWYDDRPGKSEDCLYLNIWTPSIAGPNNTKAVMYWIFGGGFFVNSIRQPFHQGDALSALGDIIVVTVSYRLGSLGFLYSGSTDAPGNVGMWDILAGLQWVNDHIEDFGGDKTCITIAGESAGSIAVGLLSVSPLSRGLYSRMIMQSGSPAYTLADDNTRSLIRSQNIAERVGCSNSNYTIMKSPKEVVDCLKGIGAMELIQAESSLSGRSSRGFLPKFDDEILPKNPRLAIIDREFHNSDVLIGNAKDEGSFQLTTTKSEIFGFFGQLNTTINKTTAESMLQVMFASFSDPAGLVRHYLPEDIDENNHEYIRHQVYTAFGDFSLLCPTVYFAENMAINNNKVYYYMWSHRSSTSPWEEWLGAAHFTDVDFVFGMPIKEADKYDGEEVGLSMDIIHKWSHFIKQGKPMEQWPLYSKDNPVFLQLSLESGINGTGPHPENCDFFRPFFGF